MSAGPTSPLSEVWACFGDTELPELRRVTEDTVLVGICGPNLRDQSKGQFHVHSADCRDLRLYGPDAALRGEVPWFADVTDRAGAVYEVYADQIGEGSPYDACRQDLHFAPCLADLPEGDER